MNNISTIHGKLTKEKIRVILEERFLNDVYTDFKNSPKVFSFKDMSKGVDRIIKAINAKEKILLVADYDVDGVVSRVLFQEFFEFINYPLLCKTPNRFDDGYGLSTKLIEGMDVDVIITADNGITSYDSADYCKKNGIDLIITDHHIASKLPDAYAIINPHQKDCGFAFKDICGAQVAWYFLVALNNKLDSKFDVSSFLDILAFAVVADMMPLISLNRVFVKKGIERFSTSTRAPVLVIKEILKRNSISSEDIGFNIAPKINAGGRMEDAQLAIDFLQAKDFSTALDKWNYLEELNTQRKQLQSSISDMAIEQVLNDNCNIAIAYSEDFHSGIIGIAASDVARKCKKASLVGSVDNDIVKFSGRSFGGIDLFKLLDYTREYFISFGGHKEAVGFSIKLSKIDCFKQDLQKAFDKNNFVYDYKKEIFGILDINHVDFGLVALLDSFEPYGQKNQRPIFLIQNIKVLQKDKIGKDKKTLKLILQSEKGELSAIKFKSDEDFIFQNENITIDILANIGINNFLGKESLQVIIDEMHVS
jgi:single-stranded-DNA-specific exonuclease